MPALDIKKFANALVPNAQPSSLVAGEALKAVTRYAKRHGGLWVGGKIIATPEGVRFLPNSMNMAFHEGLEGTFIPMTNISAVVREFGWVTGIVVVRHTEGEFRFRCFGAKRIAAILNSHAAGR